MLTQYVAAHIKEDQRDGSMNDASACAELPCYHLFDFKYSSTFYSTFRFLVRAPLVHLVGGQIQMENNFFLVLIFLQSTFFELISFLGSSILDIHHFENSS